MATFREKHDPIRLFWRRLGLLALLVLVILAASAVWKVYRKDREARILRAQSELELKQLSRERDQLSANIERLQTPRGQEETLRQQYAVGKRGEGMIIIVDPEQAGASQATSTASSKRWFENFFDW